MAAMGSPAFNKKSSTHNKHGVPFLYSPQSVLHAMDQFNHAVDTMEHNVLVPCRLQDIDDPVMGDLHAAYKLLARTKINLMYGDTVEVHRKTSRMQPPPVSPTAMTDSTMSLASDGSSETSDIGGDGDSPSPTPTLDPTMVKLHQALNQNLRTLCGILEQMTEAANRVTNLYLNEVAGP
ncbi:hypothetical protein RvY_01974 [Ramazzottius varieornatus]|uniref:Mid1-interacting protein 1 n=1 Tax=Ramazzottius varieornatus TaxID=947166 RepID=A0A1D1UST5_RAMVA|nr:hypothetical protein RvY_01974 [Ramazzottius varieornatus]